MWTKTRLTLEKKIHLILKVSIQKGVSDDSEHDLFLIEKKTCGCNFNLFECPGVKKEQGQKSIRAVFVD